MRESRTHKSIYNSAVAMSYYVLGLFLGFFSRKIFLDFLGTDILGLNTTAQNLLQFLNLAELGIGSAVGFSLYRPLKEKDETAVNEIVTLQGMLYKRIGIFIAIGGGVLMAFFPLIFKKMDLPLWYAYASFGVLLFSALLSYFVNYKQIVLTSNQKNYKVQYSYTSVTLLKIIFQMAAVYYFAEGYVWWLILEVVFAIIASIALHKTTLKDYPTLKKATATFKDLRDKYTFIVKKIKQLFFHKIAGFALTQSSPLIIYALIDLSVVTIYGNYLLIISGIQKIVFAMFNSMDAGVGNLVAEGDEVKIRKVFLELFSVRFSIAAILAFSFFSLSGPFVILWIGEEYLLPGSTVILLTVMLFIMLARFTVDTFLNAYGLYGDIWAPVIETLLNIGLSVLLGYFYGLNGIIGGVLISQFLVILFWKPFYLIMKRMNGFLGTYIRTFLVHAVMAVGIGIICWWGSNKMLDFTFDNVIVLVGIGGLLVVAYSLLLITGLAMASPGMRYFMSRIKNIAGRPSKL